MCYLIAKDPQKHGCYALKTVHGKHLAELNGLYILRPEEGFSWLQSVGRQHMEYAPYTFVKDEDEFCKLVKSM